jgi:phosphoribosylformylglycinamidine (FGAM) synthase-like enzyme
VRFLWSSAPLLSLAHDVSDGGLPAALAEAAEWSGVDADVPAAPASSRDGRSIPPGSAVIACSPEDAGLLAWHDLVPIGRVR